MTELPVTDFSQIEDGMIARIQAAMDANALPYKLRSLKTYGGELDDDLARIVMDFPAMWAVFRGARLLGRLNPGGYQFEAQFSMIVAASSLRSEAAARKGDAGRPGSYRLFMDAMKLLSGQTFGLEISALEPEGVEPLLNNKRGSQLASIYAVSFRTRFVLGIGEHAGNLDDFATFHANWDFPTFGNVGPDLPDDDNADATDTVTLETD